MQLNLKIYFHIIHWKTQQVWYVADNLEQLQNAKNPKPCSSILWGVSANSWLTLHRQCQVLQHRISQLQWVDLVKTIMNIFLYNQTAKQEGSSTNTRHGFEKWVTASIKPKHVIIFQLLLWLSNNITVVFAYIRKPVPLCIHCWNSFSLTRQHKPSICYITPGLTGTGGME